MRKAAAALGANWASLSYLVKTVMADAGSCSKLRLSAAIGDCFGKAVASQRRLTMTSMSLLTEMD